MFLLLAVIVSLLFGASFLPGHTLFSNDGPLGRLVSQCHRLPDAFTGVWEDLNSVGYREQGALPNITYALRLVLKPVGFSKFYVPIALIILGLGAWCFFRESGLAPPACVLGALAAVLNTDFFSTACWGIGAHPMTLGMTFFALAALMKTSSWRGWIRLVLAGMAVGMGLAEGADVGAILSVYVGVFVMYQAWISDGPRLKNLTAGAGRLALVAVFAAFLAAQAISALVNTQIEGVRGMQQDAQTKQDRWDWATQWSLPKREVLSLAVPGLFGFRPDSPNGGFYWGAIGRHGNWDRYLASGQQGKRPTNLLRQTGGGIYAGVTVVLVAIWTVTQSLRRKESVFNLVQRRWVWFWIGVAVVSLLFGFGRYAPFYRMLYALPYFSTIRNPIKFVTMVNFSLVVMFAYGADGLWRKYLERAKAGAPRPSEASARFDKFWNYGCLAALGASLLGWLIYANWSNSLIEYLQSVDFNATDARLLAQFSIRQVGWFVLFFILCAGLLALILRGAFRGAGANWGMALLGLLVVIDLARANQAWIIDWDYRDKYASNPVIDLLRQNPYEHRVALEPFRSRPPHDVLDALYHYEWAQHQFQFYDIQSLDVVQLSRTPQDLADFLHATAFDGNATNAHLLARRWELTNTRYLMGAAEYLDAYNQMFDPVQHRFRIVTRFNIIAKPHPISPRRFERMTAQIKPDGDYAIFEFAGGLPRAKLYSNWQINTNSKAVLDQLVDPAFDPARSVIVAGGVPAAAPVPGTNRDAGTVEFASYAPKDVVLNAQAAVPSVLLFNDRFDPNWKVLLDGQPAPLLRCNFLMRGVYLQPGPHKIEFQFLPPVGALYISLAAIAAGIVLLGVVLVPQPQTKRLPPTPAPTPAPAPPPGKESAKSAAVENSKPVNPPKGKRTASKSKR